MLGVRLALRFTGVLTLIWEGTAAAQGAVPVSQGFSVAGEPSSAQSGDAQPATPPSAAQEEVAPPASAPPASAPPALQASTPAPASTPPSSESASRTGAAASSQSLPAASPSRHRPNWNLGAGLTLTDSAPYAITYWSNAPRTPDYRVSIERRLHRDTWLSFTGGFTHASYEVPVSSQLNPPSRTKINYQTTSTSLLLGVRQAIVTELVEVSVYGAAAGAWYWTTGDALEPGEWLNSAPPGSKARTLGFSAGIAVERQLIERLSVRLSSELFTAQWSKSTPGLTYAQATGEELPPDTSHT